MEILKAIFIAIVQGITEFLPISSSGHIFLLKNILNLEIDATFDVVIHMGTLMAVIAIYRIEIKELLTGLFKKSIDSKFFGNNFARKDVIKIWLLFIIATIPAGIVGIFLEKHLDLEPSSKQNWMFLVLACCFILTGVLLFSTYFIGKKSSSSPAATKKIKEMSFFNAVIIGLFQSFAILPGISRSGTTITAALYTKLNSKDAARFSFLLSIPLITAAFLLKVFKLIQTPKAADIQFIAILSIGMIVSFIVGYISLKLLINMIQKGKFWLFSLYMIVPTIVSVVLAITPFGS